MKLPAPRPGAPGSPEHKAARWREYQERTQGQGWNYERWSNVYEQNMKKARIANAKVDAYHAKIGWGQREVSIDVGTNVRILDIADKETLKGIEYKSGYRYADSETLEQVEKDKVLVAEGWDIEWVFEGTASKPLLCTGQKIEIGVAKL